MRALRRKQKMTISTIEITGNETNDQLKDLAWQMFCNAHPIEAYERDPEAFWKYFHERAPNVSRKAMEATVTEIKQQPEN